GRTRAGRGGTTQSRRSLVLGPRRRCLGLRPHCRAGRDRGGSEGALPDRVGSRCQGRMGAVSRTGRARVTIVGRVIGVVVLCFLAGLFLSRLGITARGILTDTWATIPSSFTLLGYLAS